MLLLYQIIGERLVIREEIEQYLEYVLDHPEHHHNHKEGSCQLQIYLLKTLNILGRRVVQSHPLIRTDCCKYPKKCFELS